MGNTGYFRNPTIHGDKIAFVSEDDLWLTKIDADAPATRITSSDGQISNPVFNNDGSSIAFTSNEFGSHEVYTFDLETGNQRQLTYLGRNSQVRYWDEDKGIIFSTNYGLSNRGTQLYSIDPEGGEPQPLNYGIAITYSKSDEIEAIGRFQDDNALWKGYKGGRSGQIWYSTGDGFNQIKLPEGNHVRPIVFRSKIYFLSDMNGMADLYSYDPSNDETDQLTETDEYYFRLSSSDGKRIVMQKAGELYLFDIEDGELSKLDITYLSSREDRKSKFVDASNYLEQVEVNAEDTHVMTITRGKAFYFPFWEEGTKQIGSRHGVRYKLPAFHPEDNIVYLVSDEDDKDQIEAFDLENLDQDPDVIAEDIAIPYTTKISPNGNYLALQNNKFQIILVDLESNDAEVIHEPEYTVRTTLDWSPDSRFLTFIKQVSEDGSAVTIYDTEEEKLETVTSGEFDNSHPRFSPDGKTLYFLSNRVFHPMPNQLLFQYDFPKATKIYAITLQEDENPPTLLSPRPVSKKNNKPSKGKNKDDENDDDEDNEDNGDKEEEEDEIPEVEIDFEGIEERIVEMPVEEARIFNLEVAEDRLLFGISPAEGMSRANIFGDSEPKNTIKALILEDHQQKVVMDGISNFSLSDSRSTVIIEKGKKVRLLPFNYHKKMDQDPKKRKGTGRQSKYLDLSRIKLRIEPEKEWEQMIKETWRLMKYHYWEETMGGIDWDVILKRYLDLLEKISSRDDLSDLLWELQGETRTSHSYEMGGDYEFPPNNKPGFLGAELEWSDDDDGYLIRKILKGDVWDQRNGSPLNVAGVGIEEGDIIIAVDGQPVSRETPVQELLLGKAGTEIYLTVRNHSGETNEHIVKPVENDQPIRYRDWVEQNREYVHSQTDDKVGYLHLPDMHFGGLQEFYRYFKLETEYDGLIVDVRYNGGGHTSELFLEKLNRPHLGFSRSRYGQPSPYPSYSVPGPMVAITNEHAGSDGDIFTHSFKMMDLGPVVGKRTWGGVVGIWPKVTLVDGTVVTQPEYSFWFKDVGYGVENYGTDPDIDVDYGPDAYLEGVDPQLDRALEEINTKLDENPVEDFDLERKDNNAT